MKRTLALALAILTLAQFSQAEDGSSKFSAGSALGYSIPLGSFRDSYKGSVALALNGEYALLDALSAGMEVGYNFSYPLKDSAKTGSIVNGEAKVWQFTPYGKVQHHFSLGGKNAAVYGLFGAGIYSFKTETESAGAFIKESQSKFGWNAGAGLSLEAAAQWTFGFDLRYHQISTSGSATKSLCPTIRSAYRF